ncbi:CmcJ/NvfI family oxidoreductase [Novosphingobium sp.]|uniref:CmcJ/NvfI family oxidoreductase n=1 Tax=Novosphingobium sp. TaxID=1874826 RepID=UPI003D0AC1F5
MTTGSITTTIATASLQHAGNLRCGIDWLALFDARHHDPLVPRANAAQHMRRRVLREEKAVTRSMINYVARGGARMRYFANDSSRDTVVLDARPMDIDDAVAGQAGLDREGFALVPHRSAVVDFADSAQVADVHPQEIADLITQITGADLVVVNGTGVRRFAERSAQSGALDNSRPVRFAHVDVSDSTAAQFSARSLPQGRPAPRRAAHYNVWRALSAAPQDVPLALCDSRSVSPEDLLPADAIFDRDGVEVWSFEGLVVAHSPAHRWYWFRDLGRDEVIVFKTHDSDPARAHCVPHVAFDDPDCAADTPPRASIEMRAIAYWF